MSVKFLKKGLIKILFKLTINTLILEHMNPKSGSYANRHFVLKYPVLSQTHTS